MRLGISGGLSFAQRDLCFIVKLGDPFEHLQQKCSTDLVFGKATLVAMEKGLGVWWREIRRVVKSQKLASAGDWKMELERGLRRRRWAPWRRAP